MNAYLAHYGTKNMKWGVRRYQNEDGTLTPEGISRYRKNSESIAKLKKNVEKYRNSATRAKANADVYAANRDKVKARRFQTDLSIGKAESLERKRARASYDAAKYEKYAVQTEAKIRKLEKENGSLLTSDPKISKINKKAVDDVVSKMSGASVEDIRKKNE